MGRRNTPVVTMVPEFIAYAIQDWLKEKNVKTICALPRIAGWSVLFCIRIKSSRKEIEAKLHSHSSKPQASLGIDRIAKKSFHD